jgi:hypothetical protein
MPKTLRLQEKLDEFASAGGMPTMLSHKKNDHKFTKLRDLKSKECLKANGVQIKEVTGYSWLQTKIF